MFNNIRAEMARHNKSVADICKLLNISANTFRWKLNGERPFLLEEIRLLAEEFNCSLDYLAIKSDTTKPAA